MSITERVLGTRRQWPPSADDRELLRVWLQRRFDGIDLSRLSDDEIRKLLELRKKVATERGGINLSLLDRGDTKTFEKIVEKAANNAGMFELERANAKISAEIAALAAKARRRSVSREEEQGFLSEMNRAVASGELWAQHVGFLTLLVAQFESGETFARRNRFEGAGETLTLIVDTNFGWFGGADPDGVLSSADWIVDHLVANRWLQPIERLGPERRVRLGARTREALRSTKAAA